ncbi:AHH domain-containing protein [Chryseobacterium potabilaquae]|nr:AHH domain-containing protein [Chryseobacterium potabilaquae]
MLLLLVTNIFFLNSCRSNDLLTENETHITNSPFQLSSKTIRLDQSRHKASLNLELEKIKNTPNKLGKTTSEDVYIDTDNITYIENGLNYHTYTFNLIRSNSSDDSPLENLVLTPLPDGTYKELLVSYNLTKQEKLTLQAKGYVNIKDKVTITELSKEIFTPISKGAGMTTCGFVETYTIRGCSDVHNGVSTHNENNTSEWENCKADRKPGVHMTMTYRCDFISDTNNPSTGGGDGSSSGTEGGTYVPGGGSSIPCNGNGIATGPFDPTEDVGDGNCTGIPTTPTVTLSTFFLYVKSLPSDLKDMINDPSNSDFYEELKNYYDANSSEDSRKFITTVLKSNLPNTITAAQFRKWFLEGYSQTFQKSISLLSSDKIQEYIVINKEIEASPYEEEFIKESNEAFVAFVSYADIETMTAVQIKSVLNQCCHSIIFVPQAFIDEKTKLVIANYQLNRKFYPEWSKGKCLWEASRETLQLLLDLGGLVPLIGEVCDLTNAAIYYSIGDNLNGTLSLASSVPVVGWISASTKMGVKVLNKAASDITSRQVLKWIVGNDGLIKFGYSNQLRKVLKLKDVTQQAHHIIPWASKIQTHPVVQKAAKSKNAFHLNEALNGIPVASWRNKYNHFDYNDLIFTKLEELPPNLTEEQAYKELMAILKKAKQAIISNPNTHLNDLIF